MRGRLIGGIVGALMGGLVLGVMMQMMGMLEMLAGMVGAESAAVGWMIHAMMSALFGLVYGLVLMAVSTKLVPNLGLGAAYGAAIWVMGPMIMVPMMAGGDVMAIDAEALMTLMGHVIWGLITGAVAALVAQRLSAGSQPARERV